MFGVAGGDACWPENMFDAGVFGENMVDSTQKVQEMHEALMSHQVRAAAAMLSKLRRVRPLAVCAAPESLGCGDECMRWLHGHCCSAASALLLFCAAAVAAFTPFS